MNRAGWFLAPLAALLISHVGGADTLATTKDGKKVLLNPNGTWRYATTEEQRDQQTTAQLRLELRQPLASGCRFGFRLSNRLDSPIRTLVLRFTAIKKGGVPYQTVSRGFSSISPTNDQFREIAFQGISCEGIAKIQVSAARNCHIGDLTKYTASEASCLKRVAVQPSDQVTLFKKPEPARR